MVTGDHPTTAKAIARIIGLISEDSVTPDELENLQVTAPDEASRRSHNSWFHSRLLESPDFFLVSRLGERTWKISLVLESPEK